MATISTSVIILDRAQADGRRRIDQLHTDSLGVTYFFTALSPAGFDANADLTARATQLAANLQNAEIAANIALVSALGSLATVTLIWSTASQNASALRAAYATAAQVLAVMMGDYLSSLSDVQLQNAFGLTAPQVATLRTNKLTPAATAAATIRASAGQ